MPQRWVTHVGPHMMILIPNKAPAQHPLCPYHDPIRESRVLAKFLRHAIRRPCPTLSIAGPSAVPQTHLTGALDPSQPSSDSAVQHLSATTGSGES